MATRSRHPREGTSRRRIERFCARPQPYDPERRSREFAERMRASYAQLRGAIDLARDTARAVFGDRLRDFEVEYAEIHDTGAERMCLIVSIDAEEEVFFALRSQYHRALRSALSPADRSRILVSVEYA